MSRNALLITLLAACTGLLAWTLMVRGGPDLPSTSSPAPVEAPRAPATEQMQSSRIAVAQSVAASEVIQSPRQVHRPVATTGLVGRVVDANGSGVAGARVVVVVQGLDGLGRREHRSTSGVDGVFAVDVPGAGALWASLSVEHEEYAAVDALRSVPAGAVEFDWGDVQIDAGGTVLGRVIGAEGGFVADARVSLQAVHPAPRFKGEEQGPVAVAASDPSGSFRLSRVPAGSYRLTVAAPGRAQRTVGPITVLDDLIAELEPIELCVGYTLTGVVRRDDGHVLAGARVLLQSGGGQVCEAVRTDEDGTFSLAGVRAGSYSLKAQARGYRAATVPDVVASRGYPLNVTLLPGATIAGTVADRETGEPVRRYNAALRRAGSDGSEWVDELTRVEADPSTGGFRFDGLDAGVYIVEVTSPDHGDFRSEPIDVGGGSRDYERIYLARSHSLRVRIDTGEGGASLSKVRVELRPVGEQHGSQRPRWIQTDSDGEFLVPNVAAGDYVLRVSSAGYVPARSQAVRVGDGSSLVRVRLDPLSSLGGFVAGVSAGNRGKVARVIAWSSPRDVHRVLVESDGSYRIEGLKPGKYRVRASTDESVTSILREIGRDEGSGVEVYVRGGEYHCDLVLEQAGDRRRRAER